MELKYIVDVDNIQVKEFLKQHNCSRNLLKKVRLHNIAYVNGVAVKNYFVLKKGDELTLKIDEAINEDIVTSNYPLNILYEDEYLLIVMKEQDIASHPSRKHQSDNLLSIIKNYYQNHHILANMHIVTRLDYSTSGIVIIAKSGVIHYELSKIAIDKKYLCLVHGRFENLSGVIDLPIKRLQEFDIRRCVDKDGKPATTLYEVIKNREVSLLKVTLKTGRTHQIRVHMAYINHPLVGDSLYGITDGEKLKLHCYYICFKHPITNEVIEITDYPKWYKEEQNV